MTLKALMVAAPVAVCSPGAFGAELQAGFSRVDITPPLGSFMPGYYQERHAKSVLDPLQINCVAFSDGQATALVMQFDTEGLSNSTADGMRDAIAKATGVKVDWTSAGTVTLLATQAGGVLEVVNAPEDLGSHFTLPLVVENASGSFKNWKVIVNGEERPGLAITVHNKRLRVDSSGTAVILR